MTRFDIYESLNESLEIDARSIDIDTRITLKQVMLTGGYHIVGKKTKKRKAYPTDKQLNYAWDYLRQHNLLSIKKVFIKYGSENIKYSWGISKRNRVKKGQTVKIGEKIYKGGWFLPSEYEGD